MPLTAAEAGAMAIGEQRALNASRYNPLIDQDPMVREASEAHRVYIFNVGPWPHKRTMGSCGSYFIPACAESEPYGKPLVLQGLESESYPINETECVVIPKSGRPKQLRGEGSGQLFAQQLLGEGPMVPMKSSLRKFGVFISETPVPSPEALQRAKAELQKHLGVLVAEANQIWLRDRANAGLLIQAEWHHKAALMLMKTPAECPWLGDEMLAAERKTCPSCGRPYEVGIAECICGDILDEKKYEEKMARRERVLGKRKAKE